MISYQPPTPKELQQVLFHAEPMFISIKARLNRDWDSRATFDKVLLDLDKSSSPGWPLCKEATTIERWLYNGNFYPDVYRSEQLWRMVQAVFAGTYFHAFKIFIKQEPHTVAKARQSRWRLIMMSSLPVQVAWHMAVGHLLKQTIRKTGDHPLRHGMVYYGGGWKRFHEENLLLGRFYALDMSAWDWNSHWWAYDAMKQLYVRMTIGSTPKWEKVLDLLFEDAFRSKKIILPGGEIMQQIDEGGLMPSGLVPTIDLNGGASQLVDILARCRLGMPIDYCQVRTGDDALIRQPVSVEAYVSELQRAGCVVKEHFSCEEFMGFEIRDNGFFPKYLGKHIMNLKFQKPELLKDSLDGYLRIYVYDLPMFKFFQKVADNLGVSTRSHGYYLYFAEHPDALEVSAPAIFFKDIVSGELSVE